MPPKALLPPAAQLAKLTDSQVAEVVRATDRANAREHSYAVAALMCGTVCFIGLIGTFAYLVVHGFPKSAITVLGTGVLAIIAKMVGSRLTK